jgi:hypothetical protein
MTLVPLDNYDKNHRLHLTLFGALHKAFFY